MFVWTFHPYPLSPPTHWMGFSAPYDLDKRISAVYWVASAQDHFQQVVNDWATRCLNDPFGWLSGSFWSSP